MIGGIILAAGSSRRFGDDKRKSPLPSGRSVLEEVIHTASLVLDRLIVVIRFGDKVFAEELSTSLDDDRIRVFRAPDSALGMAHSLGNAVHEVRDWDAALIFLGDMPFVPETAIRAVLGAYEAHKADQPLIVPVCHGKQGHPVVFDQAYFDEIEALKGDVGARSLLQEHEDKVIEVDVDDEGILKDIDTPADLSA